MEITVKFSSLFKMLARVERDLVDVDEGATIEQLVRILGQKYKNLHFDSKLTYFLINNKFVNQDQVLTEGDEVSIFQTLKGR